ncbi:hypothetical protein [Frigoriflavimonas asaccharolytica]|uniref:K+-transporting ATPase c subunit n=1 Tax=Frigoriflavimonas asaccharolytica TaxID=2735899 RepID=A0A8J8GC03_9FLAO|nr:hypothetical protein [Frigoriflavimonas asaccharolytica]NRS93747.1 K+-transporting ATPase c subunit [Frigoriflavimonas asaccharolytica]
MKINIFKLNMVFLFFVGCTPSLKNNYSGYIYYKDKPLKKIKIVESSSNNYTYTNDEGYFYLKRRSTKFVNELIIQHGIEIDTVNLASKSGADSKINFLFLTSKIDTLDLYRERIFKKQSSNN